MSSEIFSRDYLQSIPEKRKQEHIKSIVDSFKIQLFNAAAEGKTSYLYVRPTDATRGPVARSWPPPLVLTDAEIIAGFFLIFPGCNIYYEETWVEATKDTKTLKKGIVIDWS